MSLTLMKMIVCTAGITGRSYPGEIQSSCIRQAEVKPVVEEFYRFIESLDISDPAMSERMKDAISYSLNQKEVVCRFLEDGRVPCDNGFAENSIRIYPFFIYMIPRNITK